jgi:hypothetical protein
MSLETRYQAHSETNKVPNRSQSINVILECVEGVLETLFHVQNS